MNFCYVLTYQTNGGIIITIMENDIEQQKEAGETTVPTKKRSKVKRGFAIFGVVLLIFILGVLTLNALLGMFKDDYYTTFGKYRLFSIVSDSMEPTIPKGSMIVCTKPQNEGEITASTSETAKNGTIITFKAKNAQGKTILLTHRVVGVSQNSDGKTVFTTRGDNPDVGTDPVKPTFDDVVGIYTGKKCGFIGMLFGFFQSALGVSMLIFFIFIVIVVWIVTWYVDRLDTRKKLENAALKKSAEALGTVNLRYDNIHEITAVMDVLGMVTENPKSTAESKMIAERLNDFINATNLELPQTPETAAILDSLPAPDTPGSLAAALSAGATLRQAEDGQTLILTTLSGDKHILLTPVQTSDGIIFCQQGVKLRSDIAPNIEEIGITSMPTAPQFFEGQPLEKHIEYPELPGPQQKLGPDRLLQTSDGLPDGVQQLLGGQSAAQQPKQAATPLQSPTKQDPALPQSAATGKAEPKKEPEPQKGKAREAYARYRELSAQLELKQAEQLHELLSDTAPLSYEDQIRVAEYKAAHPKDKKPRKPLTDEQKARRKAAAERKKREHEQFLSELSPEDRELYLTEQKLAKSRAATIRKLQRIANDRKILEKLD